MYQNHPYDRIRLRPVSGNIGAEVTEVDLRNLDEEAFAEIHHALLENEVLFFPGSKLDDESQMALAHRFGQPSVFPLLRLMGETGPTFQVIEDGPDSPNEADYWHTDVTWTEEPPKIALLRAGVVPESGGDTMWGSMTAAYDALSPLMQERLAGLEVVHDNESFIEAVGRKMGGTEESRKLLGDLRDAYPPVTQPLIRTHPETGRRAIFWGGRLHEVGRGPGSPGERDDPRFSAGAYWEFAFPLSLELDARGSCDLGRALDGWVTGG